MPKARNILVPLSVWGEGRSAANGNIMHVSSMRSNCLDHRDSGVNKAEDLTSSMHDLVVDLRPMVVVMLTVGGVSGQLRQTHAAWRCTEEGALIDRLRLPPPVRPAHGRHMHHVLKQSAKRPIVDTHTLPQSRLLHLMSGLAHLSFFLQ